MSYIELQFYYVTADPKVDEKHISREFSKCNSFQVLSDLLNSENLKVAIAHLYNKLQVCNFIMRQLTQKLVNHIFKQNTLNAMISKLQLIYSAVRTSK